MGEKMGQENSANILVNQDAMDKAKCCQSTFHYSRAEFVEYMAKEGIAEEIAVEAADKAGIDWCEEAFWRAESWNTLHNYTDKELCENLTRAGFSQEEANYASLALRRTEKAIESIEKVVKTFHISRSEAFRDLMQYGLSGKQAE